MVSFKGEKKKLQEKVEFLEQRFNQLLNAVISLNSRLNKLTKDEETEEQNKYHDWLNDDRVDKVQDFINKGVK
jgi:hypothetical protein